MDTWPFDATVATVDDGSTLSKVKSPGDGDDGADNVNCESPNVLVGIVNVPRVGASLSIVNVAFVVPARCKSVVACVAVKVAVPAFRIVTRPAEVTDAIVGSSTVYVKVPVDVEVGATRSNAESPNVLAGMDHVYVGTPFFTVTLADTDAAS